MSGTGCRGWRSSTACSIRRAWDSPPTADGSTATRSSRRGTTTPDSSWPGPPATSRCPDFTVGQSVEVRIDLAARRTYAALRTAGHLIEAAGRAQGWTHAANTHFPGQARIEFTAARPDPRLDTPEGREETTEALRTHVAKAIAEDAPVTWEYDAEGRRIVHLAGLHSAPCGGTHVRSLGDLADIVLPTLKVKKGRIRVSCSAVHRDFP